MSDDKLVVFARNRAEMMEAQTQSVAWADAKLKEHNWLLAEAEDNLEQAREAGWKLDGFQRQRRTAERKVEYYEKIYAALSAGYVIVPNFPIDIFAIRTARDYPLRNYVTTTSQWRQSDHEQSSEVLALGVGEYKDSLPTVKRYSAGKNDKDQTLYKEYADDFQDVDFPIKTVKPVIVEEVSKALALKIFDEIGISPSRRRKGDPMIVGRVIFKTSGGWSEDKSVSFLLTWWLRFEDITV